MAQNLSDFPPGPLSQYRKLASFDWKQLKAFLDTEESLEFKDRLCKEILKVPVWLEQNLQTPTLDEIRRITIQKMFALKTLNNTILQETAGNPLKQLSYVEIILPLDSSATIKYGLTFAMFSKVVTAMGTKRHERFIKGSLNGDNRLCKEMLKIPVWLEQNLQTPTLDEIRRITIQKVFALKTLNKTILPETAGDPFKNLAYTETILPLDSSATLKYGLTFAMFSNVVTAMGTKRHERFIKGSLNGDILGCFCLTEIAHGSNTKGMQTTATYDISTKQFVIHTPNFEAAKCWVGSLGHTATHAVVFAQLITPDGANKGLHAFVVEIRDPRTLLPYTGLKICDMGEKIGLNGIDNGFVMFDQFRIPRENLLNRIGDVTEDGKYVTPYQDPNKRHGASLGTLSDGRVGITGMAMVYLTKAVTIAVRYAAVRKQFSANDGEEELSILEYQTHQHRLLPHLALAYALKIFCCYIFQEYANFVELLLTKRDDVSLPDRGLEIHAISAACKPLAGWLVRDAIQECREACAGHGYLKAAALGDLRNSHDPNCTYEGENHILMQQTSNWLLKFWPSILKGQKIVTPLNSISFFNEAQQILSWKFSANSVEETVEPKNILNAFQWLVCYLLKSSYEKYKHLISSTSNSNLNKTFWAKNDCQVFFAKNLAVAYIQHLILQKMYEKILEANDIQTKNVLLQLFALFGLSSLEKHIPKLYIGGYASGPDAARLIQDSILMLCRNVKNDAIALVDVIAPPDFALNSVLGYSDGQVYKHLEAAMLRSPGALSRPSWWKEIAYWKKDNKSKL